MNSIGTTLIVASADRTIRIYEISKEQMALEMERDKKMEEDLDEELNKDLKSQFEVNNIPIKKSVETLTLAEELIEALTLSDKFKEEAYQFEINMEEYNKSIDLIKRNKSSDVKYFNLELPEQPKPVLNFLGKNIFDYMLYKLKSIKPLSELESTLSNLPYSSIQSLIFYLEYFVRNNMDIDLMARCVIFIFNLFELQLSNDKSILRYAESLKFYLKKHLKENKDLMCFNITGINFISSCWQRSVKASEFDEENKVEIGFN